MSDQHLILTVTWPVGSGGFTTTTTQYLVPSGGTRQEVYRAAMEDIQTDANIPKGTKPNTVFFSLEPNEVQP